MISTSGRATRGARRGGRSGACRMRPPRWRRRGGDLGQYGEPRLKEMAFGVEPQRQLLSDAGELLGPWPDDREFTDENVEHLGSSSASVGDTTATTRSSRPRRLATRAASALPIASQPNGGAAIRRITNRGRLAGMNGSEVADRGGQGQVGSSASRSPTTLTTSTFVTEGRISNGVGACGRSSVPRSAPSSRWRPRQCRPVRGTPTLRPAPTPSGTS